MVSHGARRWCATFLVAALMSVMAPGTPPVAAAGPDTLPTTTAPPATNTAFSRLDSLLAQIVSRVGTQSARELAASAPVSSGETIAVTIRLDSSKAVSTLQAYLVAHGATVANIGKDLIEAYVPVTELGTLSTQPDVLSVEPILPAQGDLIDPGAAIHNSPYWNAAGFNGSGIKVGIIDGGFQGYPALIGTAVPTPAGQHCYTAVGVFTSTLSDCDRYTVHGAAVAETVTAIAPGMTLYIADPISVSDVIDTVTWMHTQGVQVINFSIGYNGYWGPGNGTSAITNNPFDFVNLAVTDGIVFVNSAGNDGNGSWIGPYRGSIGHYLDYTATVNTSANYFSLSAGITYNIRIRWADSWAAPVTNIDVELFHSNGSSYDPVSGSTNPQTGLAGQFPKEFIQYTPSVSGTYAIGLYHTAGPAPAWLQVQIFNGPLLHYQDKTSSIGTPAESANPGMIAVGATGFTTPTTIESFSSQGPTLDNRVKPDITGIDCTITASYPGGFCGTSQASPHVAGLAALVRQRFPAYTPAQVVDYLKTNAIPRGASPNNAFGSGLADAPESVSLISPASGGKGGGTQTTLTGVGIGATSTVTIGSNPCTAVTPINGTTIGCTVPPAGAAGNADVVVATNGQTLTIHNAYLYLPFSTQPVGPTSGNPLPRPGVVQPSVPIVGVPSVIPTHR